MLNLYLLAAGDERWVQQEKLFKYQWRLDYHLLPTGKSEPYLGFQQTSHLSDRLSKRFEWFCRLGAQIGQRK